MSHAEQSGVAAPVQADGSAPCRVKKILIFMSTTTRSLVDLARNAQVRVRQALEEARLEAGRMVEVHVLVHGYQIEGVHDLGSMKFTFTIAHQKPLTWDWPGTADITYVPGDETVVADWVREKLPSSAASPIDSTMLVFWGHGAGIGTTLSLPRRLPGGTTHATRPCEIDVAGAFRDHAVARHLAAQLECVPHEQQKQKIDILVFDSCLMAGMELAHEYRELARYLVASQTLVETAPAGPPGLNLGGVVSAFINDRAWGGPTRLAVTAAEIADVVGDSRSGAQQLTVVRLDGDSDERHVDVARAWLRQQRDDNSGASQHLQDARRAFEKPAEGALARPLTSAIRAAAKALQGASDGSEKVDVTGLLWLFTRLLSEASFDHDERQRIIAAFRATAYVRVRQFLDLRDLARQVHETCRHRLLQLVALHLVTELAPRRDGFVVAHRAALRLEDKLRLGGVTVYCPWFKASGDGPFGPAFDVTIDHGRYRALRLPDVTGWSDFVFGPLFEATSAERRPTHADRQDDDRSLCLELLSRLVCARHCDCECDRDRRVIGRGKPSGSTLEGKPSGGSLEGKPSGGSLGPREDEEV